MTLDLKARYDVERYKPLGLVGNPFSLPDSAPEMNGTDLEIASQAHLMLGAILQASDEATPKPIMVLKAEGLPSFYSTRAIGRLQRSLASDDGLDVLHAYVQLYMMRLGRVRATLAPLGERLAFRSFDETLALYIARVFADPDDDLIAYQVLGEERLASYAERFAADPAAVTEALFGPLVVERRPELAQVTDLRLSNLETDVDEDDASAEVDSKLGDAPGTDVVLAEEADAHESDDSDQAMADYIVEYTKVHLSPVVARGLRVCRERGLAAMATEFKVTKAPRKTLKALASFAALRFKKIVLIYDGFDNWGQVPTEMRTDVVTSLSEMRWMLESEGLFVLLLEEGVVRELEEQFAAGQKVRLDFPGLPALQEAPDGLDPQVVNAWLAAATLGGAEPRTLEDPVLSALADAAGGSLKLFAAKAYAAIEDAAERGVAELDDTALAAGKDMEVTEAQVS